MKALPAFRERRKVSGLVTDFRNQPRQFGELLRREVRPARANNIRTEPFSDGRIGNLPLSGVTPGARGRVPLPNARLIQLVGEPGLADPRFTGNYGHSRAVLHCRLPG